MHDDLVLSWHEINKRERLMTSRRTDLLHKVERF